MSALSATKLSQTVGWKHLTILTAVLILLHFIFFADVSLGFENMGGGGDPSSKPQATEPKKPNAATKEKSQKPTNKDLPALDHANLKEPSVDPAKSQKPIANPATDTFQVFNPYDAVKQDEYVAVCMSVKNQARDLPEFFVHHYHHMGIKRFYIMDDGSDPPLSSYEYPGIPRSSITFTWMDPAHRVGNMQLRFYIWCIERYRTNHEWIAFVDADEFFDTPGDETFIEVLESFEKNDTVGALGVNWRMHSSGGLLTRPESVRKGFTTCIYDDIEHAGADTDNRHIKTIIKTSKAGGPINPHKFTLAEGSVTVGEDGDELTSEAFRMPITRRRVGLHHYAVKSREEFLEKVDRGNGMTDPKAEWFWDRIENIRPHEPCEEMLRYDP